MTIKESHWLIRLARWCLRRGATPNMISWIGLACACGAALCFATGAGHAAPWERGITLAYDYSWWPVSGGILVALAGIFDLLDGAVARNGNLQTRFGGVLDSTLDRFGDMAVMLGCIIYFARVANLTYVFLASVAMMMAVQISYVKARAEAFTDGMGEGFWQRGERTVAMILAGLSGHVAAALWLLALFPGFTVLRRLLLARRLLADGGDPPGDQRRPRAPWRQPRGSPGYVLVCAILASVIVAGPRLHGVLGPLPDPLRPLLGG